MFKRGIIIIALIFALSSVILGIVSFIGAIIGKLAWRDIIPRIAPMIGIGFLVWALLNLIEVQQYTYKLSELDKVNFRTMIIFWGTSAFAIISIISLVYSLSTFPKQNNRWFAGYLLLTSISMCLIMIILWQNGWIGLRTWAL